MFARLATRVPITASLASKRLSTPAFRSNSSSSSTSASRVMQYAAQAERPNASEAAVPVMWAVCAGLVYTAWTRMDERSVGDNVEKLLIV